ncbi:MAG: serine/threonine protein kinase [Akkermansiaceae bacterium]|nr:serine/threonine protein kinase [Armatimonadota bacterium]
MDLVIQGKGKISLSKADFKASGGEGSVYCRGGTAYKLYGQTDNSGKFIVNTKKMIPAGKIQELNTLTAPNIIKPQDILLDASGTPLGYTMRALPDAIALCQTFTKAYRDRRHITPDHMLKLVQQLQAGVRHVHRQGVLIVDLNEMNFLVDTGFDQLYFIDVDSYQTPHYPATAIMDSIRDRHSTQFSQNTDWFSFGIVSFQMLVGIHPFKGKHSTLKTLDERMMANVSVLNNAVSVPGACQPFDVVPKVYRDWYTAVFERGERVAPPDGLISTVVLSPVMSYILGSDNFIVEEVGSYDGSVVTVVSSNVLTTKGVWVGKHRVRLVAPGSVFGATPAYLHPVVGWLEQNQLHLTDISRQKALDISVSADEIMATGGRIYIRQGDLLMQVALTELPTRILASAQIVGKVLGQATQLFEGVAVQDLLGATYLGLLPESGFHEVRVPELDGYRLVDAKFERGVFVCIGQNKSGRYDSLIFRFDAALEKYDVRLVEDITLAGVNFTVLDTGVVALLNDEEKLELFAKTPGSSARKVVSDKGVDGSCRLFSRGAQTLIARGGTLYTITMKKVP